MSPSLSPLTVQRLAYVRYLYQQGIEQARRPSPLSASALLAYHDAVENLLGLVAEHLDIELKPSTTFLGYWEAIRPKQELPGKHNMKRLNDARVALKHGGTFPSRHSLEQARETVLDFFTTIVPAVFGVDFHTVDMVDLIAVDTTAQALRDAQTHADTGNYVKALAGLNVAFRDLLRSCSDPGNRRWVKSPFVFGPTLPMLRSLNLRNFQREPWAPRLVDLKRNVDALQKAIPPLREALQVVSLGISYADFARFKILTPEIHSGFSGPDRYFITPFHRTLTAEDYDFCRTFVIESALITASAHAVLGLGEAKEGEEAEEGGLEEGIWDGAVKSGD